jgi:hypothetical protein
MAASLFEAIVRPDWREIERREELNLRGLWRSAQLAIVALTIATLLLPGWAGEPARANGLRVLLIAGVCWGYPCWFIFRRVTGARQTGMATAAALAVLAGAAAILVVTMPAAFSAPWLAPARVWLPYLAVLAPALTWLLLHWAMHHQPKATRSLALSAHGWPRNVVIGLGVGVALGLHAWVMARFVGIQVTPHFPPLPELWWLLCYLVAIRSPGEELFFRGLAYHALTANEAPNMLRAGIWITALNACLYLIPVAAGTHPLVWFFAVGYGAIFSLIALSLRSRHDSLIPCVAANFAFNLLLSVLVLP